MSVENKQLNSCTNFSSAKIAEPLAVAHVTWRSEHRIDELNEILQDVSSLDVENKFRKYVEENIEPTGWQALWRSNRETVKSAVATEKPLDFIVDVINVNQEKLKASVLIKEICSCTEYEDRSIFKQAIIGKNVSVLLSELFPTLDQENEAIDIYTTAEVIEHIRFFYKHISLPWDNYEEICHYNPHVICNRMKTYDDIQNGVIPPKISIEMKAIKNQGKKIANDLAVLEKEVNSSPDKEYDQLEVVRLVKMSKQLNILKERYETLKDPVLRELAAHEEQLERNHILTSFSEESVSNLHLVASSVEIEKFVQCISELPNVLNTLSQTLDFSKIRTYPSLQVALDAARAYDCVVLLPGTHVLKNLGSLSRGGTILGLGDGVEIVGCMEAGDVLFDTHVEPGFLLLLQNIILKPILEQTAIYVHTGKLLMNMCKLIGGTVGISLLEKTECKLMNSSITDQEKFGVEMAKNAKLILDAGKFENCQKAAVLREEHSEVEIISDSHIIDCKIGIKFFVECIEGGPKTPGFDSHCNKDIESPKLIFRNVGENFCRSTTKL